MKQLIKLSLLKIGQLIYQNNDSKIIFYHDVHSATQYTDMSTPMTLFKEHIELIKSHGFEIVSEITNPKKQIMITFDDGFRGLYDNFQYFVENNIFVKLFVIVDYINKINYLTTNEIKEMIQSGYLSIDSHTLSHENLDSLNTNEIRIELANSRKLLQEIFGVDITGICYPRGKFSKEVIAESKKEGYTKQYSCLPGGYYEHRFEAVYNRSLVQDATPREFKAILHGGDRVFFKRYLKQQFKDLHAS